MGRISYDEFVPMAKQLIMMSYQAKDPSAVRLSFDILDWK